MDLKTERGREIVRSLAGSADVLVENFRPGTLEDWTLDHATLSAANPGLVHLSISGFGQTGRYRDRPGYDLLARGMGGLMGLTGEPEPTGRRRRSACRWTTSTAELGASSPC